MILICQSLKSLFCVILCHEQTIIIPNYEAIAITAVLTSLKFIFRLDGVTEFAFSHLMRELDEKVNPRSKLALPSYFDLEKTLKGRSFLDFIQFL